MNWDDLSYEEALTALAQVDEALRATNLEIRAARERRMAPDQGLLDKRQSLAGQVHALQRRVARTRPAKGRIPDEYRLAKAFMDEAKNTLLPDVFLNLKEKAEHALLD